MAQELTIQAVEGMTNAVDKMSTAFKGLKTSIGSIKGTNALKELQAVVQGVNRLETALQNMDKGLGSALGKVIAQLESLPTNIANAMGSSVRAATKAGEDVGKGMAAGVRKGKSAVAKEIAELQDAYEKAYAKGIKASPESLAGLKRSGVSLFPSDREIANTVSETNASFAAIYRNKVKEASKAAREEYALQKSVESDTAASYRAIYRAKLNEAKAAAREEANFAKSVASDTDATYRAIYRNKVAEAKKAAREELAFQQSVDSDTAATYRAIYRAKLNEAKLAAREEANFAKSVASDTDATYRAIYRNKVAEAKKAAREELAFQKSVESDTAATYRAIYRAKLAEAKKAIAEELAAEKAAKAARMQLASGGAKSAVAEAMQNSTAPYSLVRNRAVVSPALPTETPKLLEETAAKAKQASIGLKQLGIDANTTHSAVRGLASGFGLLWLTWGNLAPLLTGAAISNGFMATVKLGADVTKTLDSIRVLSIEADVAAGAAAGRVANQTEEVKSQVTALESQMLSLAKTGPFGLREIAEAMKTLSLAGLNASQVGASIKTVLSFAVAGDTTIKQSAETLTSVATAFRYSAEEYSIVADKIAKTAAVSKASVEDMSEAFKTASVLNAQYGASLTDVGVGLAALSNLGIKGSAAGTALRNMYVDLSGRSKEVAKIMKQLGMEIRNVDTGKFPDIITMVERLKAGLEELQTPLQRQDALNKLTSERGSKPIVEMLRQIEAQAAATGKTFNETLQGLRQQIEESAGFSKIAAVELSQTAANRIQNVFTTLQASAYEAFKGVEPVIITFAKRMREVFDSKEFKTGLASMITGVAQFTKLLVENLDTIVKLAAAYAAFKTGSFVAGMFSAAATAVMSFSAAAAAAGGVVPLLTARLGALTLGVAATGAATATAVPLLGRLLGIMGGPIGIALAGASAAWALYAAATRDATKAQQDFNSTAGKDLLEALEAEVKANERRMFAKAAGKSEADFNKEVERAKQLSEVTAAASAREQAAIAKVTEAEEALQALRKPKITGRSGVAATPSSEIKLAEAAVKAAKDKVEAVRKENAAEQERIKLAKERLIETEKILAKQTEVERAAREKAEESFRKYGDKSLPGDEDKAGGKGPSDNALQQAEKAYRDKLDTISKFADNERKVLEAGHKSKFLSETEYAAKSLQLTLKTEADKLAAVKEARAKYLSEYDKIAPKLSGQAAINAQQSKATYMGVLSNDEATFKSDAATRIKIEAQDAAGMVKRLSEEYAAFWEADKNRLNQKTTIKQFGEDFKGVAELAQAFSTAANSAAQAYADPIKATTAELSRQQVELAALKSAMDQTTDPDQMEGLLARYNSLTKAVSLTTVQVDALKAAQTEMAKAAGIDAVIDKYLSLADNNPARGFDGAGKALAGFVNSIQQATRAWEMQREVVQGVEAAIKAAAEASKEAVNRGDFEAAAAASAREAKLTADLKKVRDAAAKAEVRNYANIAGAAKSFFKEKSTGYKIMEGLEKGFRAFELAMSVKSMFQSAVEWSTKVNAAAAGHSADVAMSNAAEAAKFPAKITGIFAAVSSQLGIFGPPVAAAIVAAIGLSAAGRARGTFAPTNNGTGTVFGDSNAKSESVNNSIERLVDNSSIELTYSQGMLAALKNIEANIGGVTNQLLRGNVNSTTEERLGVGNSKSLNLGGMAIGGGLVGLATAFIGKYVPIIGKINQALFGKTTTVKGSGLVMSDQSLGSITSSGANLQEYADVNQKSKFFGITYSNKNTTVTGNADANLSRQIGLIFQDFYASLKLAATPLGKNLDDVTQRLNNFVVSIGKIDLKDLTGEQIQEKLTAVLGAAADNIAAAALPGFEAFQKVGEGYFETVVRVANGSEIAKLALERLGIGMVNLGDLVNKQGDVATEVIRQSIANVETISGSLTGVGKIVSTFSGSSTELVEVYQALLSVRESMRSMGKDAMTLSIEMIKGAGGLEALQDGLQSYYDNYLTDQERLAAMTRRVTEQFQKAGVAMPTSIEGFKEMVKGQETVTASGQETFGKMMALADAFYKLQEAMGKTESSASAIAEERKSLEDRLKQAQDEYNKAALTSVEYAALQRSAINASNLALYDQVIALEAQTASLLKAASERKALQDELNNLTLSEAQLNDIKRNALEESNRALFDQVQATKAQQAAATEAAAAAKKVADERYGLEGQLLNLQGKTAELRARELEKLAPENRELQKSIWALEDAAKANQAAQEAADAANQAAQEAADRARELREAWMDAGKGILEEVQRIRGATNNPGQNLAAAQTEFSLAVAKAQSGDVDAAKELPKLSQNLLKIAEESAASSSDLARIQSKTLATLERTLYYIENSKGVDIPGFASGGMHMGGVRVVGEDGPELEVTGPARIYNNAQLRQMMQGGQSNDKLAAELVEVKQLLATIAQDQRSYGGAIATHTASTAKVLRDVAPDRDAINIRNAAP